MTKIIITFLLLCRYRLQICSTVGDVFNPTTYLKLQLDYRLICKYLMRLLYIIRIRIKCIYSVKDFYIVI